MLVNDNREKILNAINKLSMDNRIGISLADLTIDRELETESEISEIDYTFIVDTFMPVVRKKLLETGSLAAMLKPVIERASAGGLVKIMERVFGNGKNAFLLSLINRNQHVLISNIESIVEKQGIHLGIESIAVDE